MTETALIKVEGLSRRFGARLAVDALSFSVERGEVLGFLGPNGAGKTTTMQMICGVLASSAGAVSIAGHDIIHAAARAKAHIGFLPETPPLYPDLKVDEYLHYCAQLRRVDKVNMPAALARAKACCGLDAVGGRLIRNLSKGYRQRLGIAQAIVHAPAVVILDEPTSGLDPKQIIEIRALISELGEEHSVILSTHILQEVRESCDRVLILHQGRLVLDRALNQLNPDSEQRQVSIDLKQPPAAAELARIAGVLRVVGLDKGRFRIDYAAEHDMPDRLARLAAQKGWGLQALRPQADDLTDDLEGIFMQLTQEPAP